MIHEERAHSGNIQVMVYNEKNKSHAVKGFIYSYPPYHEHIMSYAHKSDEQQIPQRGLRNIFGWQ